MSSNEWFNEWFDKHYPIEMFDSAEDRLERKKIIAVGFTLGLYYRLKYDQTKNDQSKDD